MTKIFNILFLGSLLLLTSCGDMFDYSSYVIDFEGDDRGVNLANIEKLSSNNNDDDIRIAFTGDTHVFFDEFEDFVLGVNKLNETKPIDFVIHVGDISDFGLPQQYLWGNSFLQNLNSPYFVTLGNHDMVGTGGLAYSEMFGEYDFSFIYANIKFIFVNTNSMEFNFNGDVPDINWLDSQLQPDDNFSNAVVIFHVPPMDDSFDPKLEVSFYSTIAKYNNVLFAVHGHTHHHEVYKPYSDSIEYVNVYGVEHLKFNVITIADDNFEVDTYEL
ncbi:MAG: metallophosphoesterase [Bacteroidota bacterium]